VSHFCGRSWIHLGKRRRSREETAPPLNRPALLEIYVNIAMINRPMTSSKTKHWSIVVIIIAASILGVARYGRSLREIMSALQSSTSTTNDSQHPQSTVAPPRREEFWERTEESKCFHIDNVCNWNDGWFYGPNQGRADYQPTVTLLGTNGGILRTDDQGVESMDAGLSASIRRRRADIRTLRGKVRHVRGTPALPGGVAEQ